MAFAGLAALLLGACASDPKPVVVGDTEEMKATVIAVDKQDRILMLRGPGGNEVGIYAGQDVRNFDQIVAGDKLTVSYYRGMAVAIAEPGDAGSDLELSSGRSDEGGKPGGMIGATTRATVEIMSVAKDGSAVSFRDPDGIMRSVDVQRDEMREFVRRLDQGDLVDIRFTNAVAISIGPDESE